MFLRVLFGHGGAPVISWWLSPSTCTYSWEMWLGDQFSQIFGLIEAPPVSAFLLVKPLGGLFSSSDVWWSCGPVVFVHVKNPLISWVQTKGHSLPMMPARPGVLVWTWWKLIVPRWLVLRIQWVCQSPEHIGPWETSRDLSSLSSLQPFIFWFLFLHKPSQVPMENINENSQKGTFIASSTFSSFTSPPTVAQCCTSSLA